MTYQLEVIGFNIESCAKAHDAGAHRIELCDNPADGGTTPSYGFILAARKKVSISLFPIIRPRGGDFLYSRDEFEMMKQDIVICRRSGCDGVVTGILNADGSVDKDRCSQLVELAYPLDVTFHRAFDRTKDPFKALEDIIEIGFGRILTSGLYPAAIEGAEMITSLVKRADERITVMPGSGVRSENIVALANITGAQEFHSSARNMVESSMEYRNEKMNDSTGTVSIDEIEIASMLRLLEGLEKQQVKF